MKKKIVVAVDVGFLRASGFAVMWGSTNGVGTEGVSTEGVIAQNALASRHKRHIGRHNRHKQYVGCERKVHNLHHRIGHVVNIHSRLDTLGAIGLQDASGHGIGHFGRCIANVNLRTGNVVWASI